MDSLRGTHRQKAQARRPRARLLRRITPAHNYRPVSPAEAEAYKIYDTVTSYSKMARMLDTRIYLPQLGNSG